MMEGRDMKNAVRGGHKGTKLKCLAALVGGLLLFDSRLCADQFHYANVLMGDRAMGLGGAFTAIADDASGLVYNPAGLAFSLSNDISGSANAFYNREVVYKKALGSADFTEKSGGGVAPFFGGLQKVDNMIPGVAFAFGLFNRDSELKDQDDNISDPSIGINRFHRTANLKANTSGYGVAFAKRLINSLAMGISISLLSIEELTQEYQDAETFRTNEAGQPEFQLLTQNIRQLLTAKALEIGLGVQWSMTPRFSVGINIKVPTILSQNFENGVERTTIVTTNQYETGSNTITRNVADQQTNDNPLGSWPSEYRLGLAWFVSTEMLWTLDISHFTEAKGDLKIYERNAVTNFASGVEYYITAQVPLRAGYFTNNDSRPEVQADKAGQRDHFDYSGYTLFLAWVQPNSQVALGGILQSGSGKAQKLGNKDIQNVEATSTTFALSATHNF